MPRTGTAKRLTNTRVYANADNSTEPNYVHVFACRRGDIWARLALAWHKAVTTPQINQSDCHHLPYSILFSEFMSICSTRKRKKTQKCSKSAIFPWYENYAQSINTERALLSLLPVQTLTASKRLKTKLLIHCRIFLRGNAGIFYYQLTSHPVHQGPRICRWQASQSGRGGLN